MPREAIYSPSGAAGGAVTFAETRLGADVNSVQNTWTDVLSLAIAAGANANNPGALVQLALGSNTNAQLRLLDFTNTVVLDQRELTPAAGAAISTQALSLRKVNYTQAGAWTLKLQINSTAATATVVKAATVGNSGGNISTVLFNERV